MIIFTLSLLYISSFLAMEVAPTKFIVNEDSILQELNRASSFKSYQPNDFHIALGHLVFTLNSLKYLHALECYAIKKQKKRTVSSKGIWQEKSFINWLHWYEAEIRRLIIDITKQKDYYQHNNTVLHYAARHGDLELLRFILHIGIKPSLCRYSTLSPKADIPIARLLIKYGEDINKLDILGTNAILWPLSHKLLQFYLENHINVNHIDSWKNNALLRLVNYNTRGHNDRWQNAELLIKYNINVNHINQFNKTALDELLLLMARTSYPESEPLEHLQILLHKHGAKTAQELQNQKNVQDNL